MARLLTPDEAATWLNLSRAKVYEMLRSGEIPSITVGRARRIPRAGLEAWLDERLASEGGRYAPGPAPTPRRARGLA